MGILGDMLVYMGICRYKWACMGMYVYVWVYIGISRFICYVRVNIDIYG